MNVFQIPQRALHFHFVIGILWLSTMASFGQSPVFTNAMIVGGNFQVQVLIASNASYTIETSTNLTSWTAVGSDVANTNVVTLFDNRGTAGFNQLFYRIFLGTIASFDIGFLEFADVGSFGNNFTPNTIFPAALDSYSVNISIKGDTNYPAATNVFFTGPAGCGLTNSPADPDNSGVNTNNNHANYQSLIIANPAIAPGGNWIVNYKGTNQTFLMPDPQAASRTVIPFPTVTVSGGDLQSVSWIYRDATTGATLGGAPAYVNNIQLQVHGSSIAGELYDSDQLTPATTNNVLTSTVTWTNVSGISMAYEDSLGNNYVISFRGPAVGP